MAFRADPEQAAVQLERDARAALAAGDAERAEELTRHIAEIPVAWPVRVRLDLVRVAALEQLDRHAEAVHAMRTVRELHLLVDIEQQLESEPALASAKPSRDAIRAELKKRARRPALITGALALLVLPIGGLLVAFSDSYVLECQQTTPHRADCTITRYLLGSERETRRVPGVTDADAYRTGSSGGYRMALVTDTGKADIHPNSLTGEHERAERFRAFLSDADRQRYTDRWDFDELLIMGAAVVGAALLIVLIAAARIFRVSLSPPK